MLALSLIIVGILLRLAPHAPNFTPIAAIALFSGAYLNKKYAFLVPLFLIIASDLVIGLHNVIIFTWGSFILITILGFWIKKQRSLLRIVSASFVSSVLFYIVTNFGVWFAGWYPHNLGGLINCYILGLPFLRDFTLSTLIYTSGFFAVYDLVARLVRDTKLSKVLLTN